MPGLFPADGNIRLAVITGGHAFEVPPFYELFYELPDIVSYPQHMDNFVADWARVADDYNVVLFYHMLMEDPAGELSKRQQEMFEKLGQLGNNPDQGIVVLHHAILAWPKWPFWSELVGIEERGFDYHLNQELQVEITDPEHPIVSGLATPWHLADETYTMADPLPESNNHALLGTEHDPSMRRLAWTRQFRQARVFCYQSGHDHMTYDNALYRTILERGIRWSCGRLEREAG
jgi:hypothetical protein